MSTETQRQGLGPILGIGLLVVLVGAVAVVVTAVLNVLDPESESSVEHVDPDQPALAETMTVEAVLQAVQTYVLDGDDIKAESILKRAVTEFPEDADLRVAFGEFLMQRRRFEEAYDQYAEAVRHGQPEAPLEFTAGTLASMIGRSDDAVFHYQRAQAIDPTNADYPMYLAQVQLAQGDSAGATASLIIAGKLDGNRAVVWGTLSEIALRENRLTIAAQHIERARSIEPRNTDWRVIEARILKRQSRPEDALAVLAVIPRAQQLQPPVLGTIAECYGMLQQPGEALGVYRNAIDEHGDDPKLVFEAALWAERAGERDEALALAERAERLGDQRASALVDRLSGD